MACRSNVHMKSGCYANTFIECEQSSPYKRTFFDHPMFNLPSRRHTYLPCTPFITTPIKHTTHQNSVYWMWSRPQLY
ncbi:hypothetical protein XENTR_v10009107 [Xenopus tropicalis]|nr:hypothetical protein XENTR_v10009107 [Xenopus tropicalis]